MDQKSPPAPAQLNEGQLGHLPPTLDRESFFHKDLLPRLTSVAKRFKIPDAVGEAVSWFELFSRIWSSASANPLHPTRVSRTTGTPETNPDIIRANLIGYMVVSFKHELSRQSRARQLDFSTPTFCFATEAAQQQTAIDEAIDHIDVRLSDLLDLFRDDIEKLRDERSAQSKVSRILVECCLAHFENFHSKAGNIPIVADANAVTTKQFFTAGLMQGRNPHILALLAEAEATEKDAETLKRLLVLTDPKSDSAAFRQKIVRYVENFKGGWKRRLLARSARANPRFSV